MAVVCLGVFSGRASAQFRQDAFTQNYNDDVDSLSVSDTTDKLFSFKEWAGGMAHRNTIKIGTMAAAAAVLPGTAQIYNKDYWKLPIIYGGIGACAGVGGYYLNRYKKTEVLKDKQIGTWVLAGAGLFYWGSLMDGVACYKSDRKPLPGRATIYSMLLPGLGQAYNGEYWKIPIYQGGIIASAYFVYTNNLNYQRFKWIHNQATTPGVEYTGPVSADTAKYYRDVYRRYRDYSIVALGLVYLLQVIDANVFAYMHDFEMSDDLSLKFEPAIIAPDYQFSYASNNIVNHAVGFRLGLTF